MSHSSTLHPENVRLQLLEDEHSSVSSVEEMEEDHIAIQRALFHANTPDEQ